MAHVERMEFMSLARRVAGRMLDYMCTATSPQIGYEPDEDEHDTPCSRALMLKK